MLYTYEKKNISSLDNEQSVFSCTLSDYPEEKENSIRIKVKLNSKITDQGVETVKGSIILYNKKDSLGTSLLPGDMLTIRCTPVEIINRGNPYEFDYKFYMGNRGIRYISFTSSCDILSHATPPRRKLTHQALIIRDNIIEIYKKRGINGERLAVVAAVTLGRKDMLDPDQKQNFIKAGVIHIMAVSGLHAVILSLFVFNILFFLKGRFSVVRIIITIIFLWSFAFITGLTPSVLRATLMFSFLQTGKLMKRHVNGINSVLASAFILILIKPSSIFDAGFLLSYSAVIFIISFFHDLHMKLHFNSWLSDKIWQSAVVTIVAQAGTLPLTIMLFNRFPVYFIFTNIVIVPLASLLIITGFLIPITSPVYFLSKFLASILNSLTDITGLLTEWVSALPYSTLEDIGMTIPECILLTLTIYILSYYILKKKPFSIIYPLVATFLLVTTCTFSEISTRSTNELIVFNTPSLTTIGIRTGKILNIYSDTSSVGQEVKKYCATLGLKKKINTLKNNSYCIRAGSTNILISDHPDKNILQTYRPDIVIITRTPPEMDINLPDVQAPEALIVTSGASFGYYFQRDNFFSTIDTVHIVKQSGAYIRRI